MARYCDGCYISFEKHPHIPQFETKAGQEYYTLCGCNCGLIERWNRLQPQTPEEYDALGDHSAECPAGVCLRTQYDRERKARG